MCIAGAQSRVGFGLATERGERAGRWQRNRLLRPLFGWWRDIEQPAHAAACCFNEATTSGGAVPSSNPLPARQILCERDQRLRDPKLGQCLKDV